MVHNPPIRADRELVQMEYSRGFRPKYAERSRISAWVAHNDNSAGPTYIDAEGRMWSPTAGLGRWDGAGEFLMVDTGSAVELGPGESKGSWKFTSTTSGVRPLDMANIEKRLPWAILRIASRIESS
jgi:hypothetical protein